MDFYARYDMRFMDMVLSLAFAGKAVGKMDSNGKIMIWVNKFSACMIWGVALYMAKVCFFSKIDAKRKVI